MKLKEVLKVIDGLCPFSLAEDWDHSGLQVGDAQADITRVLTAFDYTPKVLVEAIGKGAQLIITHHPFFFHPLESIDLNSTRGRLAAGLVKNDIALVSCHTNLDKLSGGVNTVLGNALGITGCKPLIPEEGGGFGVIGVLPKAMTMAAFEEKIKEALGVSALRCVGKKEKEIRWVAAMGGAGAEFMSVAKERGADVYVSADFKYHDGQAASEMGLSLIDAGHFATEVPVVSAFTDKLAEAMPTVKFYRSKVMEDFWNYR